MRWERLFADLESQSAEAERDERDLLAAELHEGTWAETSWRELLGGRVSLEVVGFGRLDGEVSLVNEHVVRVQTPATDHVVATDAVVALLAAERRRPAASAVEGRLGWAAVLRAARDDADRVRFTRRDGAGVDGTIEVVGADFVRVVTDADRRVVLPLASLAMVSVTGR